MNVVQDIYPERGTTSSTYGHIRELTWQSTSRRDMNHWRLWKCPTTSTWFNKTLRITSPLGLKRATFEALSHVSELILFILLVFSNMIISWLRSLLGLMLFKWYFMLPMNVCLNDSWSNHNDTCACFLHDLLLYLIDMCVEICYASCSKLSSCLTA